MMYPLTSEDQCTKCGHYVPARPTKGHDGEWCNVCANEGCACPPKRPRGKSTGRPPSTRKALSEAPLTAGWTVVWRGTRGSATGTAHRIQTGFYRPDLVGKIEVTTAHDGPEYLVIWRKRQ